MAFWGCEFIFNGISCKAFDLMVYNTDGGTQNDVSFPSFSKVHEERVPSRYSSYFYGSEQNEPLEFTITFGLNPDMLDSGKYLTRDVIASITSWLTGSGGYKKLEILQDDLIGIYYMGRVSELKLLTNGMMPYGFSCIFTCDSPFAYMAETEYACSVYGTEEIELWNSSTYNGFYMPRIVIQKHNYGDISIVNHSDGDREFRFSGISNGCVLYIDNSQQIITSETGDNPYSHFNFKFFRMKPRKNVITLSGAFDIRFIFNFPVNVGA